MENIVFYPTRRYLLKLYLKALVGLPLFPIIIMFISLRDFPRIGGTILGGLLGVFVVLALILLAIVVVYFNTIRYEIHEDEIVVYIGLLTRTVKHVPFRTITNMEVKRTLLDQILGIGSLSIQTAGSGGASTPEEKLMGLDNVQQVYEYVAKELRRFRQGMSPTQADSDPQPAEAINQQVLVAILRELRLIRGMLEGRN